MIDSLNVAQTGLNISKTQVEGVMNNLANENTPGYKTRVVDTAELDHLDDRLTGRGVYTEGVRRITDDYMYQNLLEEQSKQNALEELDIMLEEIESIFHETDESGLSADLVRYFESLENLRTSPNNEIYKNDLKNNAETLVINLKTLYEEIEDFEDKSLSTAKDFVEDINNKLLKIGDLSNDIINSNGVQNDLLDRRDKLEQELAEYIDVEIFRDNNYQLKIGDQTAVRFDTNIHEVKLVEDYVAQKDIYVQDGVYPYTSNLINTATWEGSNVVAEVQTIEVTGTSTGSVEFLGTTVAGSLVGDTAEDTIDKIILDSANIIANWNANYPEKEINTITKTAADQLTITYQSTEGDVPVIDIDTINGVTFDYSEEATKGAADTITYKLNNEVEVTVAYGETINNVPIGTSPETYENITVDETNAIRALVHKINVNTEMLGKVTAYNGQYELDDDGNKVLTNNVDHSDYDALDPNKDRYLIVEATLDGEKGKFTGEIIINDASAGNVTSRSHAQKSETFSKDALDDIHLEIFDERLEIKAGKIDSIINNIQTDSGDNKFQVYKDRLDNFAKALSDMSDSYIETAQDEYVYGRTAVETHSQYEEKVEVNLFTGADVTSLTFNSNKISSLTQDKLDYLSTIRWKEDIDFDGTGYNNSSFSKFYQTTRFEIANNREDVRFLRESQDAVTESINNTYDKLTKVDKDKEMVDLIKFQSAYEANAKIITIVDEMIQTILGMHR